MALLLLLTRPTWSQAVMDWERPQLVVLLDQSNSMTIRDAPGAGGETRAEAVNTLLAECTSRISNLNSLYDVRLLSVGDLPHQLDEWRIQPNTGSTALAAALRVAAQARWGDGQAAVAVLLISDGAENASDPQVVRQAAGELAAQRTALLALGIGPDESAAPAVVFDALVVPARIGRRERLQVSIAANLQGCAGHVVSLELLWDQTLGESVSVPIGDRSYRLTREFSMEPPSPGLHRLIARIRLPAALGGGTFETSAVVDVRDDRIRVLLVDGRPRSELAFVARALRSDPRFEVAQQVLLRDPATHRPPDAPDWNDYDVVVIGDIGDGALDSKVIEQLVSRVRDHELGLLLAGGSELFHSGSYARSDFMDVSPVEFSPGSAAPRDYRPRFVPTPEGLRHAVLRMDSDSGAQRGWPQLPELSGAAVFGKLKPLAEMLAADEAGRPLLVAHEVGNGRCLAAAWESSWPWALHSDAGQALHKRLWRQLAAWLANRRPHAWVLSDQTAYPRSAVTAGQQKIVVRAGVSGQEAPAAAEASSVNVRLRLRRVSDAIDSQIPGPASEAPLDLPLTRQGDEWVVHLADAAGARARLTNGEFELEFVAEPGHIRELTTDSRSPLSARTRFRILEVDRELLPPTHNLQLLRDAAAATSSAGGEYAPVNSLPAVLERLLESDRRRRIERVVQFDPVRHRPWLLLTVVSIALGAEWLLRKRAGLR
jgi:uncharacterized membrane protein